MLTQLRIRNFKSWRDTGEVRLAPLTVIFGANSAGKSSIGHLMLALKQTALSSDRNRALDLGDDNSLIDLGTFADIVHKHDESQPLDFNLRWALDKDLEIRNAIRLGERFTGDSLDLNATLAVIKKGGPLEVRDIDYKLRKRDEITLEARISKKSDGSFDLKAKPLKLVKAVGRGWSIGPPEKFYRLSERGLARFQNAGFLTDFSLATEAALRSLYFLGPLRAPPRRIYQWSGNAPADVGPLGEFAAAAMLAATQELRGLSLGKRQRLKVFSEFIADRMKAIGVIEEFRVRPIASGRKDYEVLVRTAEGDPEVKLTDVGIGVSQILPALVEAFYCPPNSTVWMEQPEIHLHPQVQAELADVFIDAIGAYENGKPRNTQLIVESHSEHFLNRLQRRIAERKIQADQVAIHFANRVEGEAVLEPLRLTSDGEIENWPENFFGDQMADVAGRMLAAIERRQAAKAS